MRENVGDKGEQAGGADVAQRGNHQHGEDFFGDDGVAHAGNQIFDGDGAFAKEFFHQIVIAFGNHFDQFFVRGFGFVGERGGNFFDGGLAVAIGLVHVGLHGHQVDHAAKTFFRADGKLQGHDVAAKNRFQRFHGAFEAGELAIHPGEHKRAGDIVLGAVIPNFFGGNLRADVRVHSDQGGIRGDQRSFGFGDERGISGQVDEINFDVSAGAQRARPFGVGQPGLNGNFSRDFFFVPVGGGTAVRNF